jgi:hypothetical protein
MKSLVALLLILSSTPAFAAQCGKAEMPTPNGDCIRVCPPGDYHIGKDAGGYQSCLRDGNATVTAHTKYAFVSLTERNTTDNICFGIRPDETAVDTVVDNRFVDMDWHAHNSQIWVAEISYTLDPSLTTLHVTAARHYLVDQNKQISGVSPTPIPENVVVALYDSPQANWPCTKQQWATIMAEPRYTAVPPPGGGSPGPGGGVSPPSNWYYQQQQQQYWKKQNICNNPQVYGGTSAFSVCR